MKVKCLTSFLTVCILALSCDTKPALKPTISFDQYRVADGFELQLAAAEPLIEAPVAMDFDDQGRMWVVEMRGYMPNLTGKGEDAPNGRISILDDFNEQGVAQRSTVFIDSLVLPRAIAHVYGGLLYSAPPNLWFVEVNNDRPGKRTLVDSLYSDGGNPESQPNGLLMNIDNWIYSANAHFRYQLNNGKWLKEPTSFRGQWGITKDNYGRLYYNYNETQLVGDYVLPNSFIDNPYLSPKAAINKVLTENQRVYPLHPTTVNRGSEGVLNKDSMLINFTAACGPSVYRGNQFPDEYNQNVFVCEPQANLIKRNRLFFQGYTTTAEQVWNEKEFVASFDEGFRPVNLLGGPDGALYVVDMHRGIIQHQAYATPYYRHSIAQKKLDTILRAGRILRVKYKGKALNKIPKLETATAEELANLLKSSNGWVRDRAQQLLINRNETSVVPQLVNMVRDKKNTITAIHALHTLNGLNALSFELLRQLASYESPILTSHALLLLKKYSSNDNAEAMSVLANQLMAKKDSVINLYLAASLETWIRISEKKFLPILEKLYEMYAAVPVFQEAIINSLKGSEENFAARMTSISNGNVNKGFKQMLTATINNKREGKMNPIFVEVKIPMYSRQNGLVLFRNTCATCHGPDGEGIQYLGPPLDGSEYLEGSTERLAMIILNGLSGPVHVNGQLYKFNGSMPAFGSNYTDREIADIIEYLHNSFIPGSRPPVDEEKIKILRGKKTGVLTEEDLLKMPAEKD